MQKNKIKYSELGEKSHYRAIQDLLSIPDLILKSVVRVRGGFRVEGQEYDWIRGEYTTLYSIDNIRNLRIYFRKFRPEHYWLIRGDVSSIFFRN